MILYHKSFGSGKADYCASKRFMSDADYALYKDAREAFESRDSNTLLDDFNEWMGTISDEESREYWKLADEAIAAEGESGEETETLKIAREKRDNYYDSHGTHKCKGCAYWSDKVDGMCSLHECFIGKNRTACSEFRTTRHESENLQAQVINWESDDERTFVCEKVSKRMRKEAAENLRDSIANTKQHKTVASTVSVIGEDYYKMLYNDFPEVFSGTICPTFDEFKRVVLRM